MGADMDQVLRILRYREIDIRVEDGRLIARSRDVSGADILFDFASGYQERAAPENGALPEEMIRFIAHFKDRLVTHILAETQETAA